MNLVEKLVEDFLMEVIGKDVLNLFNLLKNKEPVSEFKLAEKMNLTVNQVRNMLYRLYSKTIVDFIRKKDKKKGWYIYYWAFNMRKALELAIEHKQNKLEIMRNLLEKEQSGQYFNCPDGDVRLNSERAIENNFRCPECDKVLIQDNNARKVQNLIKNIAAIEQEIREAKEIKIEEIKVRETKTRAKRKVKKKEVKVKKPPKKKAAKKKLIKKKPTSKKIKFKTKKPKKKS